MERVGPVAREGEREWAARERVEAWAQARAAVVRKGGNRCGELGREAADWAGAGLTGPSGKRDGLRVGLWFWVLGWVCLFYFYSSLFSISNSNNV